jgi:putative FmdB family regulatory protein
VPTYQYSCTECGHFFETVQSFTDDSLTTCPECGGRLRKVFNAVGVVFKGSGFYRNDSRSQKADAEPAPASNGSEGGPRSGSDSKPKKAGESRPSTTKSESSSGKSESSPSAPAPTG